MLRFLASLIIIIPSVNASATSLTLTAIAPRVRASHPALKAARLAVEEARGRQLSAGRLPNPTAGLEFQNESRVSPQATTFSIDQTFPLTRRLSLEKQLTSQLVTAAELEVRDAERRLIEEAQTIAVELLALAEQKALRQQQTELATVLAEFVKGRADAGELSALDAAQAQLDAQRLLVEAKKLDNETVSLLGRLKPMLGLAPYDTLGLAGGMPPLRLPSDGEGWTQRADYQLGQTKIAAAKTETEVAKAKKWQDASAGIFTAREQQDMPPANRERTGSVGIRVSVPLPFWNRNQGEIAEKAASAERARLENEALSKIIASEVETARDEMQAHADLAKQTKDKLLPLVTEQASKLEQAYKTGQIDLLTLLRAREQRLQIESAALDAVRDFHLARIRYEAATGQHAKPTRR